MDPYDDSQEMNCEKLASQMVKPHSIDEDIHELLTEPLNWTEYMTEVNSLLREFPRTKHGRNHDNTENTEERFKRMHKSKYCNLVLKYSTANT